MNRFLTIVVTIFIAAATRAAVALDDGQVWWGFYTEDMPLTGIGEDKAYNYNCAMYVEGDNAVVGGCTVTAIRFPLAYKTSNLRSAKVWVGTKLPADGEKADIAEVSILDARLVGLSDNGAPMNEVKLKVPVVIPEGGLYIGYSLKVRATTRPEESVPILTAQPPSTSVHRQQASFLWRPPPFPLLSLPFSGNLILVFFS